MQTYCYNIFLISSIPFHKDEMKWKQLKIKFFFIFDCWNEWNWSGMGVLLPPLSRNANVGVVGYMFWPQPHTSLQFSFIPSFSLSLLIQIKSTLSSSFIKQQRKQASQAKQKSYSFV